MHSHFLKKFLKETRHFSERWLFLKKWNNAHRGLSCHKCKKKFCHHKDLSNFHIKALLFFILFFLVIVPLSFILVSIFCEFDMLLDVYILLSPQEEEVHSSSSGNRCTHLAAHSSKRLNPLSFIILVCLGNT